MKNEHTMSSQWPITSFKHNLYVRQTEQSVKFRSQVNSILFGIFPKINILSSFPFVLECEMKGKVKKSDENDLCN